MITNSDNSIAIRAITSDAINEGLTSIESESRFLQSHELLQLETGTKNLLNGAFNMGRGRQRLKGLENIRFRLGLETFSRHKTDIDNHQRLMGINREKRYEGLLLEVTGVHVLEIMFQINIESGLVKFFSSKANIDKYPILSMLFAKLNAIDELTPTEILEKLANNGLEESDFEIIIGHGKTLIPGANKSYIEKVNRLVASSFSVKQSLN